MSAFNNRFGVAGRKHSAIAVLSAIVAYIEGEYRMLRSHSFRRLRFLRLSAPCRFALVALLLAGACSYPTLAQNGANGSDGDKGTVGNPGKDGTAGTNGTGMTSGATVTGGFGGRGGTGGDAAANSRGNDGGDGGKGGSATSNVNANNATATAVGGRPGSGGSGSAANRIDTTLNNKVKGGDGGNAGVNAGLDPAVVGVTNNGDAFATAVAPNGDANARATADGNAPSASLRGTAGSGGDGGPGSTQGGKGGSGAAGGDATATATAQGAGGEAGAFATAGKGGPGGAGGSATPTVSEVGDVMTGGKGGNGAKGGDATATATAMNGGIAAAIAVAGDGGDAGIGGRGNTAKGAFGDNAGKGGTARATATATNANGDALAAARANAGSGGDIAPGKRPIQRATPGDATATATANAPNGDATANPTAINGLGKGGTATAIGMATGQGGAANPAAMTSQSTEKQRTRINNRADSPIPNGAMGQVQGEAAVGIAAPLPALKPNATLNSFAATIGDPLLSDLLATSAGKPNVINGLNIGGNADQLALVEMGGLYPYLSSGSAATYSATSSLSFDPDLISGYDFRVGLQDAQWTGNGFDVLQFMITEDDTILLDESFKSLSSAISFFTDHVIDIGFIEPDSLGLLNIAFDLEVTAHVPGDGFAIDLALAAVPEPPNWVLLATAITIMLTCVAVARHTERRAPVGSGNSSIGRMARLLHRSQHWIRIQHPPTRDRGADCQVVCIGQRA